MIIDSHVHILNDAWSGISPVKIEDMIERFSKCGVDSIVVSAVDGLVHNNEKIHRENNMRMAQIQERFKGVVYGLATVNPKEISAIYQIEEAIKEFNLKGVKLHPWLQAFSLNSSDLNKVCRKISEMNVPALFHDGTPPYSAPSQFAFIAERFPDLRIILGHSGLNDLWPEAVEVALRYDNIYLCICATPFIALKTIVKKIGAERVLFGTDAGFGLIENFVKLHIDKVKYLNLAEEENDNILFKNAQRLFNI